MAMRRTDWQDRAAGAAAVALAALGATLGGCSGVSQKDYDMVFQENRELRERYAALEGENARARQRIAELEEAQARADTRVASADPTGFEGISGVGVSRTAGGEVVVAIAGDVLFDSGSADLKPASRASLDRIAGVLNQRYAGHLIRIEGHTDTDPIRKSKWQTNERLSFERANAVEEYLATRGVSKDRMYTAAFGPAHPKSSKRESRRVEIVILAQGM